MTQEKSRLQKYSAPALEKGLDILELLSLSAGQGLSHAEIAEGVGRSKNEIFRMMVVLEEREYIKRTAGETFRLTSRFENLFVRKDDVARMVQISQPVMARLSEETRKSNHLWVLRDSHMEVVFRSDMPAAYSLSVSEGTKGTLFATSAGACFLSEFPDPAAQQEKLRAHGEFVGDAEFSAFQHSIDACQREGFCTLHNRDAQSIVEVSAPIRSTPDHLVVGALSVPLIGVPGFENEVSRIADCLKSAVRDISDRMALLSVFNAAG